MDTSSQVPMSDKEKRELRFSEVLLIVLSIVGLGAVIWLAWMHD